ncbi:MAG: phosphotransferase [Eubacteriales bacterium]|nr:phosphotransferase [Eubacteriales bacterium]
MKRVEGLEEYVKEGRYRKALGLPSHREEIYTWIGQGEYNINYSFVHPVSRKKLLLRVNCGSQMHLEHQIEYEYDALKCLEGSGRTPHVYYVDGSGEKIDHGILVMEFLPGRALDYHKELYEAASCLADIHSTSVENHRLICPENPLQSILCECERMYEVYEKSSLGSPETKKQVRKLLEIGRKKVDAFSYETPWRCCINTELNSTNFLSGGKHGTMYLIDWEKPLYADPAQDLGHFLAPTTTFWKTDVILTREAMKDFVKEYVRCVGGRFPTEGMSERTQMFMAINCLRGISWCAMAWIQYRQKGKMLVNESTKEKLDAYLDDDFLQRIDACVQAV